MARFYVFNDENDTLIGDYDDLQSAYHAGYAEPAWSNSFHLAAKDGDAFTTIAVRDCVALTIAGVGAVTLCGWRFTDGTFVGIDERY